MKKETENKIIELHKMVEGFSMDYHQKSLIRDKINEILACEANDRKFGKVDLYDYVSKETQYPILHGIYHKDGKVYATDARILCRCVRDYDSKYEGQVIGRDGKLIEGCYPNADSVIPNTRGWTHIPIDFNKVEQSRKKWVAHKKIYKKAALGRFAIGNQFIDMPYFFMMCDLMKKWGITEVVQCPDSNMHSFRPLVAEDDNNTVILMPVYFDDEQLSAPEVLVIGL
jgi:hypothetical protein